MRDRFVPLAFFLCSVALAFAQPPPPGAPRRDGGPGPGPGMPPGRPGFDRPLRGGPPGKWWTDPQVVQQLGLTDEQQKKIEDLFQKSRLKLIDLSAAVQKEEAILDPLLAADHPDESKVLAQIDRIAQARGELEKANARMLLGFRGVLTQEQWKKLQTEGPGPPRDGRR